MIPDAGRHVCSPREKWQLPDSSLRKVKPTPHGIGVQMQTRTRRSLNAATGIALSALLTLAGAATQVSATAHVADAPLAQSQDLPSDTGWG